MSQYTFPSSVVNFVTFTAKRWGQSPLISYVAGGIAGSEVVTVDSNLNISVLIQSGVSTNAQIKAAIEATSPSVNGLSAGDLVSIAITGGHSADTNTAGTSSAMTGAVAPNTLGYFMDQNGTTLTTSFQLLSFAFAARYCTIINDETTGTKTVVFSWDGINNHGILYPGQSMMIDTVNANVIFLKEINGAPAYRLMAKAF